MEDFLSGLSPEQLQAFLNMVYVFSAALGLLLLAQIISFLVWIFSSVANFIAATLLVGAAYWVIYPIISAAS